MKFEIKSLIKAGKVSIIGPTTITVDAGKSIIITQEQAASMPHIIDEYVKYGLISLVQVEDVVSPETVEPSNIDTAEVELKKARIAELRSEIEKYKSQYKAATGDEKKQLSNKLKPMVDELKKLTA